MRSCDARRDGCAASCWCCRHVRGQVAPRAERVRRRRPLHRPRGRLPRRPHGRRDRSRATRQILFACRSSSATEARCSRTDRRPSRRRSRSIRSTTWVSTRSSGGCWGGRWASGPARSCCSGSSSTPLVGCTLDYGVGGASDVTPPPTACPPDKSGIVRADVITTLEGGYTYVPCVT